MRKKIITNTIIFVSIILFVTIFKSLFGEGNTLVGVTIITTALTFMEKDLTAAIQNIWIGILVNFLALFIIGYLFSYNLKRSLVVPFGLQYFFMLFYPAEGEVLFNRFLSLIFGSVFIMLIQFIFNKDKVFKAGSRILDSISDNILLKIKAIQDTCNILFTVAFFAAFSFLCSSLCLLSCFSLSILLSISLYFLFGVNTVLPLI